MARKKVSQKRLREAIHQCRGNVTEICSVDVLNISRQTFYNYKRDLDWVDDAMRDARESIVDLAESQLMKHLTLANGGMGDFNAVKFTLQTFGKDRGWTTRHEITGKDGAALFESGLDADVLEFLRSKGLTAEEAMSEAVSQFNEMMKELIEEER